MRALKTSLRVPRTLMCAGIIVFGACTTSAAADAVTMTLRGDADGFLHGSVRDATTGEPADQVAIVVEYAGTDKSINGGTDTNGTFRLRIPDAWLKDAAAIVRVTAEQDGAECTNLFPLRKMLPVYLPPLEMWGDSKITDSPESAYHSIGLTPWHLGRNPEMIRQFHAFLLDQEIDPLSLSVAQLPETTRRILIEPELAGGGSWKAAGECITSGAGDRGPQHKVGLSIDRPSMYRIWIRYKEWAGGTAVTAVRLYRKGKESGAPILTDEFNGRAGESDTFRWHSFMTDLDAGEYTIVLAHVIRYWHTAKSVAHRNRLVDCLYLTDELWAGAPSDAAIQSIRAASEPAAGYWIMKPPLAEDDKGHWQLWQVRPSHWGTAADDPKLFNLSYRFWRGIVADIAAKDYSAPPRDAIAGGAPDYRDPRRQVIFDDIWNMVGNPRYVQRQIDVLENDVDPAARDYLWRWLWPGRFKTVTGQWHRSGGGLSADHAARKGNAIEAVELDAGSWHVWVRFKNINYYEHFGITITGDLENVVTWERTERMYPMDIQGRAAWQKVGVAKLPKPGTVNVDVWMKGYINPRTYRGVYGMFITQDPDYKPRAHLEPTTSRRGYFDKVKKSGATPEDGYVLKAGIDTGTIAQTSWPSPNDPSPSLDIVVPRDGMRRASLIFRSARETPVTVKISVGPLKRRSKSFPRAVTWRVVAFAPYGDTRGQWSPLFFLRRPFMNIPPLGVAQAWITVDARGVPPGDCTAKVKIESAASDGSRFPDREVTLNVRVSKVRVEPKRPILVHGWVTPPAGDDYRDDWFRRFNVWQGPFFSKKEMKQHGLALQVVAQWNLNENQIRSHIERAKKLGLDYDDWMFSIKDEPTGQTEAQLAPYINIVKMIRSIDPNVRVVLNPGEAARDATFRILQPYCDFWNPYQMHLSFAPSGKRWMEKPYMYYSTPCYQDKQHGISGTMYNQIRSVLKKPADCRGTAFFAPYYPWRDPWDTRYEHIKDVSTMVFPSRHGPVATPAWEAILAAVQHANLAVMVRELAPKDDADAQNLVKAGSMPALVEWLEKFRGYVVRSTDQKDKTGSKPAKRRGPTDEQIAAAEEAALKLRQAVIDGVANGKQANVRIRFYGSETQVRVTGADKEGILVSAASIEAGIKWSDLPPKGFCAIARKYTNDHRALAVYRRGMGLR